MVTGLWNGTKNVFNKPGRLLNQLIFRDNNNICFTNQIIKKYLQAYIADGGVKKQSSYWHWLFEELVTLTTTEVCGNVMIKELH